MLGLQALLDAGQARRWLAEMDAGRLALTTSTTPCRWALTSASLAPSKRTRWRDARGKIAGS